MSVPLRVVDTSAWIECNPHPAPAGHTSCRSSNNMGSHTERRNHQIFLKRCGSYLTASYYYRKRRYLDHHVAALLVMTVI